MNSLFVVLSTAAPPDAKRRRPQKLRADVNGLEERGHELGVLRDYRETRGEPAVRR